MHAIAEYGTQLMKQAPKLRTRLFIETIGPFSSILDVDSTQLECARSVIIQR